MKIELSKTDFQTILLALDELRIKNTRQVLVPAQWVQNKEHGGFKFEHSYLKNVPNKIAKRAWSVEKYIKSQTK